MEISKAHYKKEIIAMAVLVVISLLGFFVVIPNQIPETSAFSTAGGVGSRTVPYMVVVVIGVLAFAEIIKNIVLMSKVKQEVKKIDSPEEKQEARAKLIKTFGLYGLFILFGLLFMFTGFLLACLISLPIILYVLGIRHKGYYIGIIVFSGITYVLFRYVLEVIVPLFSIGG